MTFNSNHDAWLAGLPPVEEINDFEAAEAAFDARQTASAAPTAQAGTSTVGALAVGAAVAGAALLSAKPARAVTPALKFSDIPGSGDIQILNYALALEALEADLYRQALGRLNALGVAHTELDSAYYQKFGLIEAGHRDFLNNTLAGQSLLKKAPFSTATFDFGINNLSRAQVAELVLDAERTGVNAYLGVIQLLSSSTYRQIAAAIQGTEARHTTVLYIITNRLGFASSPRNVAPVRSTESSAANNDIESTGRELLKITSGNAVGTFQAQPTANSSGTTGADNVLAKVSPFIVINSG